MTTQNALFTYTLRLADSSLILAQRLSEWTGHGPFLEEDLALTNIALDLFGRAKSLLEYAGQIEGEGRNEDTLAYFRNERQFYNFLLTEQPNGDYAQTMLRQAFIDCYELLLYTGLSQCKDETLAAIAAKSIKEITYHKRHSFSWVNRFGNGTEESSQRLIRAFDNLWSFTGEMFETNEIDEKLQKEGIINSKSILAQWQKEISELLSSTGIKIPESIYMQTGSQKGIHSEHLGFILAEMQTLPRMYPEAKW